jgi:hypothetical protein
MRRTTILGFNMDRQSVRRRLVVAVYALLALLVASGWVLDHLRSTAAYIFWAAFFINYFVLGGYGPEGLVRPFTGTGFRHRPIPSSLVELELYAAGNLEKTPSDYRNDERELQRRDRVHYQAYQALCVLLAGIWLIAVWTLHPPRFIPAGLLPFLLYLIVFPATLLAITLPQAIILWTEPDLIPDPGDEPQTATRTVQ